MKLLDSTLASGNLAGHCESDLPIKKQIAQGSKDSRNCVESVQPEPSTYLLREDDVLK